MKNKASLCIWLPVTACLAALVAAEAHHLVTEHLMCDSSEYGRTLLSAVQSAAAKAEPSDSEEDLVRKYNATNGCFVSAETMTRNLHLGQQGQYMSVVNGAGDMVMLDWVFYEIDPVLDYYGQLEIGLLDGKIKELRVVYSTQLQGVFDSFDGE